MAEWFHSFASFFFLPLFPTMTLRCSLPLPPPPLPPRLNEWWRLKWRLSVLSVEKIRSQPVSQPPSTHTHTNIYTRLSVLPPSKTRVSQYTFMPFLFFSFTFSSSSFLHLPSDLHTLTIIRSAIFLPCRAFSSFIPSFFLSPRRLLKA